MKLYSIGHIFWTLIIFIFFGTSYAQIVSIRTEIANIIEQVDGKVGVAIIGVEDSDTLTYNDDYHYPMQSVYKFPLALAVLHEIDKGILSLDQEIYIGKEYLLPNTWSPLRDKYPNGNINITPRELLTYTIAESDNNGCDILFRLMGGPGEINKFVHNLGIREMDIISTEEEMHKDSELQYKNWCTPSAMAELFRKFAHDSILAATSKNFLWDVLVSTVHGSKRIKGQLPGGTIVAHKTGSSGVNDKGLAAATNDAGIVSLPNGKNFIVVVFVSDSHDNEKTRERIIAKIAKAAWDFYSAQ